MDGMYFKPFTTDASASNAGQAWEDWLEDYNNFAVVFNISKDDGRMIAGLKHFAGENIVKIYKSLNQKPEMVYGTEDDPKDSTKKIQVAVVDKYADVCRKLSAYFNPKRS